MSSDSVTHSSPNGQPKPCPTTVGQVIGTRTSTALVKDGAMQLPSSWKTERFAVEDGQMIGRDASSHTCSAGLVSLFVYLIDSTC